MRSFHRTAFAATLLALAMPTRARAQIEFGDLLSHVTDIAVSGNCWSARSESLRGLQCPRSNYGLEVLWEVGTLPLGGPKPAVVTTWVPSEKTVTVRQGHADTVTTLTRKEEEVVDPRAYRLVVELGVGYSNFSGFTSSDARFELRGSVREQPSVAVYGSLEGPGILERVGPYVGLRSGLVRLGDVQAFIPPEGDPVDVYHASAELIQVGVSAGVAAEIFESASVFVEGQLNLRRFNSVDWTGGEAATIPGFLPRSLDFGGPSLSFGVQIHVRNEPEP
jgi:hypothetical protein